MFITLPSGLRVNTDHIITFKLKDDGLNIEFRHGFIVESMTSEQLDALLSPPVHHTGPLRIQKPKADDAVEFMWDGKLRTGLFFCSVHTRPNTDWIIMSDGVKFTFDCSTGDITKFQ